VVQSIAEVRRRAGGRVPPHNLEAEESLLGAMLLSRDAIALAAEARVEVGDFYKPAHSHIFEAIMALYGQGEPVDPVTVAEELRRVELLDPLGGKPALLRLQAETPASANAAHYANIVTELALLRRLIGVAGEIAESAYDSSDDVTETLDRAESLVFDVAERRVSESMTDLYGALQSAMDQLEAIYGRDVDVIGLPTGYTDLDHILLGMQPENLIVVAARPSIGKSAFAIGAAQHVAVAERKPVLLFSMEMGQLEITKRILAAEARVPARKLQLGNLNEREWDQIVRAIGRLGESKLFIDDNPHCTIMEMRAKARRIRAREGELGLIVVDYLQLMTTPQRAENRQTEVSELSRGLKLLARELQCPVMALSQLNRQLEYRQDKRPMLADLRESGCVTADTLVTRCDTNEDVPIGHLLLRGETAIPVWTLDEHFKLVPGTMMHVFPTGEKVVFDLQLASGRSVKASANHPFLTLEGWRRLDELQPGDRIAVPRRIPAPARPGRWTDAELILLGHMIGDGCHLPTHAVQYTTTDAENVGPVVDAARELFGIEARVQQERTWMQVYLPPPFRLTHGVRNPLGEWLDRLGLWGKRSWEKFVPREVFTLDERQIALFLRHLWATDGCVSRNRSTGHWHVVYGTTSLRLARDVQSLLLRLDIRSRLRSVTPPERGRPGFTVTISGSESQLHFADVVGVHGERMTHVLDMIEDLVPRLSRAKGDAVPAGVWDYLIAKYGEERTRSLSNSRQRSGISRSRLARIAVEFGDRHLGNLAESDVLWDEVKTIEVLGLMPVFDATVADHHNFLANNVVVSNSIEQDSDVVLFLYRDEVYNPDSDDRGKAEVLVAKHRNGPTGKAELAFHPDRVQFANMAVD
jgi:replicative DNA helicase